MHTGGQPKWVCIGLIGLGFVCGATAAWMSTRYGQRMSVDDEGWWTMGGATLTLSAVAFALSGIAGGLLRTKRALGICFGVAFFGVACVFLGFIAVNSIGFAGHQTIGKSALLESKHKSAQDIAEIQNKTTLKERGELRDVLSRTYVTAKKKEEKDDALAKM